MVTHPCGNAHQRCRIPVEYRRVPCVSQWSMNFCVCMCDMYEHGRFDVRVAVENENALVCMHLCVCTCMFALVCMHSCVEHARVHVCVSIE